MPVTSRMFRGFDDNGWMFSKVLAVAVCGYAQWLLACLKITPFTGITCVILTVICCLGSLLYGIKYKNRFPDSLPWKQAALVYREEILLMNTKTEGNTFTKKIGRQSMMSVIISMKIQRKQCRRRLNGCRLQKQAEWQCTKIWWM